MKYVTAIISIGACFAITETRAAESESRNEYGRAVFVCAQSGKSFEECDRQAKLERKGLTRQKAAPGSSHVGMVAAVVRTPASQKSAANGGEDDTQSKSPFLLRRSMEDIQSFAQPKDFSTAAGAEFGWAKDSITKNITWSALGIFAVPLTYENPKPERFAPYLVAYTFAPYVQFDRVTNTVDKKNNADNLTFGFSNETSWGNLFGATQYLRANGELVTDFEGRGHNWAITGEWQPIGNPTYNGTDTILSFLGTPLPLGPPVLGGGPLYVFTLSPKAKFEYRGDLANSQDPIFEKKNSVLRGGPTVTLAVDGVDVLKYVPWWVKTVDFQVTYGYLRDFLSDKNYNLLDTSLTFGLDPASHLGLTISYRNGEIEATGKQVNLTKVTLSGKF